MLHSAILSIVIKLPFVLTTFVLSIFTWLLKKGFTVDDTRKMFCCFSQSIVKDQGLLKILVSRASKYLQSLKVSELKVEKLTEQLTAVQKVSSANKEQLEKAKKQVM